MSITSWILIVIQLLILRELRRINGSGNDVYPRHIGTPSLPLQPEPGKKSEYDMELEPEPDTLSIISLTDEMLLLIFSHLNQIEVTQLMAIHSRFYQPGKRKLFNSIYVTGDLSPLKISRDIHTPFYIKFTIINNTTRFEELYKQMKLDLVRNIVFGNDIKSSYEWFDILNSWFPQLTILVEFPTVGSSWYLQETQVGRLHQFILDNSSIFQEMKSEHIASIQELCLLRFPPSYEHFQNIPKFENLQILKLREVFDHFHHLFKFNEIKQLQVQQLRIFWKSAINPAFITDLGSMFNLSKLTLLELHFCSQENPPPTYESDLQNLMSQLFNLKHLLLTSRHIEFSRLINSLKPNSLSSLQLRAIPPFRARKHIHGEFSMNEFLERQGHSIVRINLCTSYPHRICPDGLDEFNRIYRTPQQNYEYVQAMDVRMIGFFTLPGCPKLEQVLLNERCYFITRYSDGRPPKIISIHDPEDFPRSIGDY